ncbi:MAG: hypothetical protein FGO69_08705 [Methanobacterium sp.]|nr:MAG: hypothetical protein FGO69_08705 [Methanobacterium sp.]
MNFTYNDDTTTNGDIYGYVYSIRNNTNDKHYIGQTTRNIPEIRWNEHINNPQDSSAIDRAVQKYGESNFTFNVIDTAKDQELEALE